MVSGAYARLAAAPVDQLAKQAAAVAPAPPPSALVLASTRRSIEETLRDVDARVALERETRDQLLAARPLLAPALVEPLDPEFADLPGMASLAALAGEVRALENEEMGTQLLGTESPPANIVERIIGPVFDKVLAVLRDAKDAWLGFDRELGPPPGAGRWRMQLDGDAAVTLPAGIDSAAMHGACERAGDALRAASERYQLVVMTSTRVIEIVARIISMVVTSWWGLIRAIAEGLKLLFDLIRKP